MCFVCVIESDVICVGVFSVSMCVCVCQFSVLLWVTVFCMLFRGCFVSVRVCLVCL